MEDNVTKSDEELKLLKDFVNEASDRLSLRVSLLDQNIAVTGKWPDDSVLAKKDSTLKKNTAFVKKLRNFVDSQKDAILNEFDALNLSKYVEEVATAIVDAKLKTTDIPFVLRLSSAMYQRYADFSSLFLGAWKKVFSSYKDVKNVNLSKLRVDLMLFADLNTIGVFPEAESLRILAMQLTSITSGDVGTFSNISLISSFCRHCSDDWIGLIPYRIRLLSDKYKIQVPRSAFIPIERKSKCRALFQDYLAAATQHLLCKTKDVRRLLAKNRIQLENMGEVSDERREEADQLLSICRKFHESLVTLTDLLDSQPLSSFDSLVKIDDSVTECADATTTDQTDSQSQLQLFEDEDTRLFYESLPDVKAMIPGILYKDSEQAKSDANTEKSEEVMEHVVEDIDVEALESELALEEALYKSGTEVIEPLSSRDKPMLVGSAVDDVIEEPGSSGQALMETFLTQLPSCVNRDMIDRAAEEFCLNLNKRSNRKRLARTLVTVPRTRYDLLPFYSRLIGTLAPVMSDLVEDVNTALIREFRWLLAKNDQSKLEWKLKNVRFMGELVKFRVFPAQQALACVKQLLPNFTHHNIEMACGLLDTCGRFLFRSPSTHQRTKVYLDVMLRKKTALLMDQRYTIMIENSYYYCNPPTARRQLPDVIPLTPTMQYLRRQLYSGLSRHTVNNVLRIFRKMDWKDAELVRFVEKLFTCVGDIGYNSVSCLSSVLSGLSAYHSKFAISVVENVIEDIRVGMELNQPYLSQRRVSMVRYLGLLYNYCVIDSPIIFKTLYSLITFGVSLSLNFPNMVDPPDSTFRILLVCTLLDVSGSFFHRGKKKQKMDVFLAYFQRYYWFKRSLPIWVQPEKPGNDTEGDNQNVAPNSETGVLFEEAERKEDISFIPDGVDRAGEDSIAAKEKQPTPTFIPVPFPSDIEQKYTETLDQLKPNIPIVKDLVEAEQLVGKLESQYLSEVTGLMSKVNDATGAVNDNSECPSSRGGPMDTITEECEPYYDDDEADDDDDDDEEPGNIRRRVSLDEAEETVDYGRDGSVDNRGFEVELKTEPDSSSKDSFSDEDDEESHAVRLGLKPNYIDCPEDAEFREALDRMTAEALLSTASTVGGAIGGSGTPGVTGTAGDSNRNVLPAPEVLQQTAMKFQVEVNRQSDTVDNSLLPASQMKSGDQNCWPALDDCIAQESPTMEKPGTVMFNLVSRRANRPYIVPLVVPETVQFAARYRQSEAAEREEKARMKRLVLNMHEAQKVEEMESGNQDAVLAHQFPLNVNRDRWIRYTHPKNAPCTDTIFGNTSQRR